MGTHVFVDGEGPGGPRLEIELGARAIPCFVDEPSTKELLFACVVPGTYVPTETRSGDVANWHERRRVRISLRRRIAWRSDVPLGDMQIAWLTVARKLTFAP